MNLLANLCNVVFWLFFCMVMVTDGPPRGTDLLLSIIPFLMPVINIMVIRLLTSPGRNLRLVTLFGNICWIGLACWQILARYPSHPEEEGLVAYVALMALTPLVSAAAISIRLRASQHAASV